MFPFFSRYFTRGDGEAVSGLRILLVFVGRWGGGGGVFGLLAFSFLFVWLVHIMKAMGFFTIFKGGKRGKGVF